MTSRPTGRNHVTNNRISMVTSGELFIEIIKIGGAHVPPFKRHNIINVRTRNSRNRDRVVVPMERENEFGRSLPILDTTEAKRRLEQVDERLSCAVCLGRYRDPRMLDCRHSFCKRCLVDVLKKRLWDPQYPLGACP